VTTPTFSAPRRANDEQDGRAVAGGHPADPGLAKRTAAAGAAPVKNSAARRRSDYDGFVSVLTARDRETEHRRVAGGRLAARLCCARTTEFNRCAPSPVDACKERMQMFIDQLAKNAPAGPEATVSTWKPATQTTRSFYETMQKNHRTVAQATRSDLPAVSSTAQGNARCGRPGVVCREAMMLRHGNPCSRAYGRHRDHNVRPPRLDAASDRTGG
jgi:hypothetical protein